MDCQQEIHNQIYDTKACTVTITVVSCCPEKIKNKICCKGGKAVKCIEIKVPEKPKPPPEKPKEQEKPKPPPEKPKEPPPPPKPTPKPPPPQPVPGHPPPVCPRTCCRECYQGFGGGPCYHGYGGPAPHYEPYGRPVYDSWGGGGGCSCRRDGYYVCRCDYVYDHNPSSCRIMWRENQSCPKHRRPLKIIGFKVPLKIHWIQIQRYSDGHSVVPVIQAFTLISSLYVIITHDHVVAFSS